MCVFLLPLHMRPRVQRAPGLPCALLFVGANEFAKLGRSVSREHEVASRNINVIARSEATKQSSSFFVAPGLLRFARNDETCVVPALRRDPYGADSRCIAGAKALCSY